MANRTSYKAQSIHGVDPQSLIEQIIRNKIHSSRYWKERCFGLSPETLLEEAVKLKYVGGTYGPLQKPTPFLALALKMLQIQPDPR